MASSVSCGYSYWMAEVCITCPSTGKLVDAGLSPMTQATFSAMPDSEYRTDCPACGAFHFWEKKDAALVGNPYVAIAPLHEDEPL